jgi:hypothetical protein
MFIYCFLAASLMKSGVLSQVPKLKLMISFPCALSSLAKAAIANVCRWQDCESGCSLILF